MTRQRSNPVWRVVLVILATTATAAAADDEGDGFIELFNGKDLTGWKVKGDEGGFWKVGTASLDPKDPRELVVDPAGKELINARRRGRDIYSEKEFGDAIIELEVMVPRGSNSGIYIMGEYEIQVCDSYGREKLTQGDMGAIYSAAAPSAQASKAPGEWQSYHIRYRAPRFDADGKENRQRQGRAGCPERRGDPQGCRGPGSHRRQPPQPRGRSRSAPVPGRPWPGVLSQDPRQASRLPALIGATARRCSHIYPVCPGQRRWPLGVVRPTSA